MPPDNPVHTTTFDDVAAALRDRFQRTGLIEDLDHAIIIYEWAVGASAQQDRSQLIDRLIVLTQLLLSRFEFGGSPDDLNRAISLNQIVYEFVPIDSHESSALANDLCTALQYRYDILGSIEDLDRSIELNENALKNISECDTSRIPLLNGLSNSLQCRFERTESIQDLDKAINSSELAIASMVEEDPRMPVLLNTLACALQVKYEETGSLLDLDGAINAFTRVLNLTPNGDSGRVGRLNNLSVVLYNRHERTGSVDDLNRAIEVNEEAVALAPKNYPKRAALMSNLSNSYLARFERLGNLDDLDLSIAIKKQAIQITPKEHSNYGLRINALGNALHSRFARTRSLDDLDQAIKVQEEAVKSLPDDHSELAMLLHNLGIDFLSRYKRIDFSEDLNKSISSIDRAIRLKNVDYPHYGMFLSSYSSALHSRYKDSKSMADLYESISSAERSVSITPDGHAGRGRRLAGLGSVLDSLFRFSGSLEDLDRAIDVKHRAVTCTPETHPNRSNRFKSLGNSLEARFRITKTNSDLDRAIESYRQAFATDTASPLTRVSAAIDASRLLLERDIKLSLPYLRAAVELLPLISPRTIKQSDQQFNISLFAGTTAKAVSVSLECGESPWDALQLLELGRGVLVGLQLEMRSDISVLRISHPTLAQQLDEIRDRLNQPPIDNDEISLIRLNTAYEHRRLLMSQFESLLKSIRSLDGFERFLLGPSESITKELARGGAIIVFNISEIRSDAFLIDTKTVRSIRLPLLKHVDLEANYKRFHAVLQTLSEQTYSQVREEISRILEWLWDVAVEPTLREVGFIGRPEPANWPRVWWIGSGFLSNLPIHAAGYHDSIPPRSALDSVISSYIPTLRSLAYAGERSSRSAVVNIQKAMLIAMPKTPEHKDLPFAELEILAVQKQLYSAVLTNVITQPTRDQVLSSLGDHHIVHMACHGLSSPVDPSQSKFLLTDWKNSPLVVEDLMKMNFPCPKLAFLSACHSAMSRDLNLSDESINLSAAMLLAGYPSVVGTLWQISDEDSVEVVKRFYKILFKGDFVQTERAAEGLHYTVRLERERTRRQAGFTRIFPSDPLVWAPFIHFGI